jgi:hypothetical protein
MRNSGIVNKTVRRLLGFGLALLAVLVTGPAAALAQDITVTGSPIVGLLPHMITAFVSSGDVLPPGTAPEDDSYVFTLFDTGSTRINFDSITAAFLGVINGMILDSRINGLGAIDPASLNAPIYAGQAQAEVLGVTVSFLSSHPDRTLIGGPVTNIVKAGIDYTTTVTRGPYGFIPGGYITGPDITFYPSGSDVGYTPAITLNMQVTVDPTPTPAEGNRYLMFGVSFNDGSNSVATPASGDLNVAGTRFLYDTGTTVTMLTAAKATELGLTGPPDFTQEMSGGTILNGYYVDSITMTGLGGVYTVLDAPVVVAALLGGVDVRIGSNIFSQVKLLFDGPAATLGISLPVANEAPVADAGEDQVIEATGPTTSFTLDGTDSSDPDGDTLTYGWKDANGIVVGDAATATLGRGLGIFVFTLTVTDAGGLTAEDTVSITIRDTTPPALTAPPDITVPESDPIGTAVNLGQPTVSDNYDTVFTVSNNAPALFPLGDTTVTWTVSDSSGNASNAQQKVTVEPGTPLNQLRNLVKLINYSVASGGVAPEMQTSLLAKINAAIAALVRGNANASKVAMNDLKALVNQVEAQTDKKITPPVAAEIIVRANRIIVALGG